MTSRLPSTEVRQRGRLRPAPVLLAVGLLVSACATAGPGPSALPAGLVGTSWRAQTIAGTPVAGGTESTLSFLPDGQVAGSGGCNRYAGHVDAKDGRLRLGPLASTMMACPPEQMGQEQRFLAALDGAVRLTRDGDLLVLEGPSGTAPTRLAPLTEPVTP